MWYSDPRVLRLPRISLKSQLVVYLVGVPVLAWEIGTFQRKTFMCEIRENADTQYPFYGQRWGAQTDYAIECSLKTGDLLFLNYERGSLHSWEAILQVFRCNAWDRVGVIEQGSGGATVHFGDSSIPYRDVLADYRTCNVGVRRLVGSPSLTNSINNVLSYEKHRNGKVISNCLSKLFYAFGAMIGEAVTAENSILCDDTRFVLSIYSRASMSPKSIPTGNILPTVDYLSNAETVGDARLDRFFYPRNGASSFTYHKKTGYLGSLSYKRLNEGKTGSPAF